MYKTARNRPSYSCLRMRRDRSTRQTLRLKVEFKFSVENIVRQIIPNITKTLCKKKLCVQLPQITLEFQYSDFTVFFYDDQHAA